MSHVMAGRSARSGSAPVWSLLVWLLPVIGLVGGLGVLAAVPWSARRLVAWAVLVGVVLLFAAAMAATWPRKQIAQLSRRAGEAERSQGQMTRQMAALTRRVARAEASQAVLTGGVLLAGLDRVWREEDIEDVIADLAPGADCSEAMAEAYADVASVLRAVEERTVGRSDSARRAFVSLAQRVQTVHNQLLKRLRELQEKYGSDSGVFEDLLEVDHRAAQVGRLADGIAIAGGARPGRQYRKPVELMRVVRAAQGRIAEFQRVELRGLPVVGVAGPTVEGLIHSLGELLANATEFSPRTTLVKVSAEECFGGVMLEITDHGLGMAADRLAWARKVLSGERRPDLEDLGEHPRFGLMSVARMAHELGFTVEVHSSRRGGVRVEVFLPGALLTALPPEATAVPAPGARHALPAPAAPVRAAVEAGGQAVADGHTLNGLPRRKVIAPPPAPASAPSHAQSDPARRRAAVANIQRVRGGSGAAARTDLTTTAPVTEN